MAAIDTRALFGDLNSTLDWLISCRTTGIGSTIFDRSGLKSIREQYYQYPRDEVLFYLDLALKKVKEIHQLGDKIYQNLIDKIIDEGSYDEETGEPWNNTEVSRTNGYLFLNKVETTLTDIKNNLLKEPQFIATSRNTSKSNPSLRKGVSKKSLLYNKYDTNPENLDDLLSGLKKGGFVKATTNPQHFKRIFSGGDILSPVQWVGTKEELYFFIMRIHPPKDSPESPKIQPERRNIWKIVCQCFVDADGKDFISSTMKGQHAPTDEKVALLQKLTNLL